MKDKYDLAAEELLAAPDFQAAVHAGWCCMGATESDALGLPHGAPRNPLFQYCTPTGASGKRPDGKACGCLTQVRVVRGTSLVAWTPELTRKIAADDRLPTNPSNVMPEHLELFKWYQRYLDVNLRGVEHPCDVPASTPRAESVPS